MKKQIQKKIITKALLIVLTGLLCFNNSFAQNSTNTKEKGIGSIIKPLITGSLFSLAYCGLSTLLEKKLSPKSYKKTAIGPSIAFLGGIGLYYAFTKSISLLKNTVNRFKKSIKKLNQNSKNNNGTFNLLVNVNTTSNNTEKRQSYINELKDDPINKHAIFLDSPPTINASKEKVQENFDYNYKTVFNQAIQEKKNKVFLILFDCIELCLEFAYNAIQKQIQFIKSNDLDVTLIISSGKETQKEKLNDFEILVKKTKGKSLSKNTVNPFEKSNKNLTPLLLKKLNQNSKNNNGTFNLLVDVNTTDNNIKKRQSYINTLQTNPKNIKAIFLELHTTDKSKETMQANFNEIYKKQSEKAIKEKKDKVFIILFDCAELYLDFVFDAIQKQIQFINEGLQVILVVSSGKEIPEEKLKNLKKLVKKTNGRLMEKEDKNNTKYGASYKNGNELHIFKKTFKNPWDL